MTTIKIKSSHSGLNLAIAGLVGFRSRTRSRIIRYSRVRATNGSATATYSEGCSSEVESNRGKESAVNLKVSK
jgi:hypothetical protein